MRPNDYFEYAGTAAASGTIVGTQAANQAYVLFEVQLQLEGTGPQTMTLGGGSVARRVYCANAGDGVIDCFGSRVNDEGLWRTTAGSALTITSSGSALYNYYVRGYVAKEY